jgi:heat shock protein HslJ
MRLGLLLATLLAACSAAASPSAEPFDPNDMLGSWQLEAGTSGGAAIPIVDGHRITLTISGPEINGTSACNSYGGKMAAAGNEVRITEIGQTLMGCEDEVMASEAAYIEALRSVVRAALDGEDLVLSGTGIVLRFVRLEEVAQAELVDTVWVLESLLMGDVATAAMGEASLELRSDGTLHGFTGCRQLTGTYLVEGDEVLVTQLSVDGDCPMGTGQQDEQVTTVIADGFVPHVKGDTLTVTARGNLGLAYRAQP